MNELMTDCTESDFVTKIKKECLHHAVVHGKNKTSPFISDMPPMSHCEYKPHVDVICTDITILRRKSITTAK